MRTKSNWLCICSW